MTATSENFDATLTARFMGHARRFCRSWSATLSLATFGLLLLAAIAAPLIAPQNPYDLLSLNILDGNLPPGSKAMDGSIYLLGTDDQGRDVLSALLFGLRTSVVVGLSAAALAFAIGSLIGLLAANAGKRVEAVIMRLVDLQLSFPTILLALLLIALLGKGVLNVVLAIVLVEWALYARTARGAALSEINREYVSAARGLMLPGWRIVLVHLLPNCLSPLMVLLTMQIARAITLEATLSFLGLGVPITQPSLGLLIANGFDFMLSGSYWISFFPGIVLLVLVFSINMIGDHLRVVLNPKERR